MNKPCFLKLIFSVLLIQLLALNCHADQAFKLEDVRGQRENIHFQDFSGDVILLDFWASWCGPCRQSFPWMNDMHAKYADLGLRVVAINLDNDTEAAQEFLAEVPANFILGFDPEGNAAEQMQVEAMPMSYLIDRNGQIRFRLMGFNSGTKAEHEAHIQTLLSEPGR